MGETTDQIRQEVDKKRDDAAHKIDEIEQRVNDSVHRVQEGVTQTTEQVKATVQDTIEGTQQAIGQTAQQVTEQVKTTTHQVTEQVKANFDWQKQIEERPLVMVGAAFLGGFVLGSLTGGDGDERGRHRAPDMPGYTYGGPLYGSQMATSSQRAQQPSQSQGMGAGATSAMGGGGLTESLRGLVQQSGLQDTLTNSASALISSFGDRIRTTLEEQVPGFKEQMQKQSDQSSPSGTSSRSGQAGGFGQATEAATSDATGRTSPYLGEHESRQGTSSPSPFASS